MACTTHGNHSHAHGATCGHMRVMHDGHEDYLHDGHMHHVHGDHVDEHRLAVSPANPDTCSAVPPGNGHPAGHVHGPGCGHESIPHGEHTDYLVSGRLHHAHDGHCDDHGTVATL